MEHTMSDADLGEMLGICYMYQEMGHKQFTINSEHAVEILERLIAHEQGEHK